MKKVQNIALWVLAVVVGEMVLFWGVGQFFADKAIQYQLTARYSARVSLGLFSGLYLWVGLEGWKTIYASNQKQTVAWTVWLVLAVNHAVHFYFLAMTHHLLGWELWTGKSLGGAIGYVIILIMPLILWDKKELTRGVYAMLLFAFVYLEMIFFVSYLGRWNRDLTLASSPVVYQACALWVVLLFLLNLRRVWLDRGKSW
ncbi:hypothetical protein [Reichenbachiella sp. MSK19-1]|uniref:hypothetical protein n=1 Tax=Reichenbachiella sp. MSK19-1 TaxID=1897631 RepID=UPI000E6BEEE8|nr:hypothetical protein [Reichenbachiella sp. MSK19-1]RJE70679.1 hypothetical protein BGP76_11405 [Reichenbachiella sp. MSK19-1]